MGAYKNSKYDRTVNLNVGESCCWIPCSIGASGSYDVHADQYSKEISNGQRENFLRHFIAQDGEALLWAASVLAQLHNDVMSDAQREQLSYDVTAEGSRLYGRPPRERES